MKIYAISGLGADKRVFDSLSLDYELIHLDWITTHKNESIESYAKRLSEGIDVKSDFCILGVSFGGLIATEISKFLKPKATILISSVHTKNELRAIYRFVGKMGILKLIPTFLFDIPRCIATYIFGAKNNKLLHDILEDTDLSFAKWATNALVTWKNTTQLKNVLKINGTKDKLIQPRGNTPMILIEKGAHFMIVDKAVEVSNCINEVIKSVLITL